ncbi:MAG: restriction endonuclease subunit S, partial [Porphyromonadaceae bacterium]|nr:restriction endonuclease subunit S [Porphyromonadaceae bacterium]
MFGDPQINPNGYKWVKLSEVATYFNGLTYKPENVAEVGTIVLRSSNIQNSQLDFADTVRVNCNLKEKFMVQENDILMCSRNGSARLVGKVALLKEIQEPMTFGAFMMIIRSSYYSYLMVYFQMDAFRQQIKSGATTTINQITGRMLDDVTIPLPPMKLIDQFADFVAQVDKSKLAVQKSLE